MPYRDERTAMRERIAELERALSAREEEVEALRARLRRAEVRVLARRAGWSVVTGGVGTFAGLTMMTPIASMSGGELDLIAFGGIIGGLFGLLMGLGHDISGG
jgi:predicted RNase H-like nuclease (RuvC/YqgF family)